MVCRTIMRKFFWYLIALILCLTAVVFFDSREYAFARDGVVSTESKEFLARISKALAEIGEVAKPSVVNISTTTTVSMEDHSLGELFSDPFFRRFFGDNFDQNAPKRKFKSMALGSGVIVSRDGYILTNYHVIQNAEEIKVILNDKREFKGKVIGSDPQTDISVIKIDAGDLPAIRMGESANLKAGDVVIAIGNPFGLNQTITMGIVSAVGRANLGITDYEDFIQTDAAINPGNSGGALVNINGELIGINTAIFSTSGGYMGVGFAIPSDMANTVVQSILKYGKVIRGYMGVTVQDLTPELAKSLNIKQDKGSLVTDVVKDSPAEKAGLKRGDLIVEYDGKSVDNSANLRNMAANTAPGKAVKVRIVREGRQETLTVTIGEVPETKTAKKEEYNNALKGIQVQDITPDLREGLNIPDNVKGVLVANVSDDSPAQVVLTKGDIIQEINRKAIANINDYGNIVSKIGPSDSVLLLIYRNGGYIYVTIKPQQEKGS